MTHLIMNYCKDGTAEQTCDLLEIAASLGLVDFDTLIHLSP